MLPLPASAVVGVKSITPAVRAHTCREFLFDAAF
jgi:hypothetical protein